MAGFDIGTDWAAGLGGIVDNLSNINTSGITDNFPGVGGGGGGSWVDGLASGGSALLGFVTPFISGASGFGGGNVPTNKTNVSSSSASINQGFGNIGDMSGNEVLDSIGVGVVVSVASAAIVYYFIKGR